MRTRVLAAISVIGLAAGCGGSTPGPTRPGPSATTSRPGQSHEQFVARLNELCNSGNEKVARLNKRAARAQAKDDWEGTAAAYAGAVPLYESAIARMRRLGPPPPDRPAFASYIASQERVRGLVVRLVAALRAHDADSATFISDQMTRERKRRLDAALDLGADGCGA